MRFVKAKATKWLYELVEAAKQPWRQVIFFSQGSPKARVWGYGRGLEAEWMGGGSGGVTI